LNTLYGYANALRGMEKHEAAIANYTKLLTRIPDHAGALNNRGWCLMSLKRFDEAFSDFERAIVLAPDHQGAILNKALWLLLHGDFKRGFALYDARQKLLKPMGYRNFPQPQWTGAETLEGKTLFVHSEQGLGDCVQFFRFLSVLPAARTIFAVPPRLMRLLQSGGAPVEFIAEDQVPDGFDFHLPLMSLAKACHLRPDAIPGRDGYLSAEPRLVASWADRIGRHGFRIGIIWHGKDGALGANDKSFDLKCLSPLAQIPGVRLIGLQKGESVRQLNDPPQTMPVERFAFDEGPDAFIDTAAIMKNLDLVIAPDCAGAHLAGALGVPAWVALKHVPDWRWLLDRDDSPWYASLRLFRQAKRGEWTSVFAQMEAELRKAAPIPATS
jgi:tetratricopeptide (TPR) repeat protein